MTNEEKDILLKDLCARLPHSVKCEIDDIDEPLELESIKFKGDYFIFGNGVYERYITEIKPYLRPLSSMTEEEKNNLGIILPCSMSFSYSTDGDLIIYTDEEYDSDHYFSKFVEVQDFLNAHHFDYRGLIEMGLALEASEGMYK